MRKNIKKIIRPLSRIRLDEHERAVIRAALERHVGADILSENAHIRSGVFGYALRVGIASLLVALAGGSMVYGAERSLPGDLLYPVKIGVNERVLRYAARSPAERAFLEVRLVERRLEEAEALTQSGKGISDREENEIVRQLDAHIRSVARIQQSEEDASQAVDLLEERLSSHLGVLDMAATSSVQDRELIAFVSASLEELRTARGFGEGRKILDETLPRDDKRPVSGGLALGEKENIPVSGDSGDEVLVQGDTMEGGGPAPAASIGISKNGAANTYSEVPALHISHRFSDGVHIYTGTVDAPTPCHDINARGEVGQFPWGEGVEMTIDLIPPSGSGGCTLVETPKDFLVSVKAGPEARLIKLYVRDEIIPFVVDEQ